MSAVLNYSIINQEKDKFLAWGIKAIKAEITGLELLSKSIDENFYISVSAILECKGKVVLAGMGKSGIVGKKIVATLSSTGTSAIFVHPAEASHGDLGMIEKRDIVIALSKSGESPELSDILNFCRRYEIKVIAITENENSSLAKVASYLLKIPRIAEACPLNLAPTTSTTMMMALGDAIAIACLQARNFNAAKFKDFHPGGKLGQKLSRAKDIMHGRTLLPLISNQCKIKDAVIEMSRGRFGCVAITDESGNYVGIFTDGDLRRHISDESLNEPIINVMHKNPYRVSPDTLIADIANLFTKKRIPSVFVCENTIPVGIIHVHDLLQKGFL